MGLITGMLELLSDIIIMIADDSVKQKFGSQVPNEAVGGMTFM